MPLWALYIEYAQEFGGMHPAEVPKRVTVAWFERWKYWRKAQASKTLWDIWRRDAKASAKFDKDELDTWLWAMLADKR